MGRLHLEKKVEIHPIPKFISEDELLHEVIRKDGHQRIVNRGWYVGKRKIPETEVAALREEAKQFSQSFLWELMRRDVHFIAYLRATAKARTDSDLIYAGAMYYDLELLETFIEKCKSL